MSPGLIAILIAAMVGVIAGSVGAAALDTNPGVPTGGMFGTLGFIGFIVWMLVSSIVMVRRPLVG